MPPIIQGYSREQGYHRVDPSTLGTAPVQPETVPEPPAPPDEPAAPAQPDPSVTPPVPSEPPTDDDAAQVLTDDTTKRQRPFVARILRENGAYQARVAQLEAQLQARDALLLHQAQRQAGQEPPDPQPGQPAPPASGQVPVPPRWEDFNNDQWAYLRAMDAHERALQTYWRTMAAEEAQRVAKEQLQAWVREQADTAQRARLDATKRALVGKLTQGYNAYDNFDQAITTLDSTLGQTPLYPAVQQYVAQSAQGAALLHYLGTHPDALEQVQYRNEAGVQAYLAALEAQLTKPAAPSPGAAPPVAPPLPPVRPLSGNPGTALPPSHDLGAIAQQGGGLRLYMRGMREQQHSRGGRGQ